MTKGSKQLALTLSATLLSTAFAWRNNYRSLIGIDDASIYMAYMRNLASGQGFVYSSSGERVEGFTSLLWTLLGALYFDISSAPEILLLITNILGISFALWKLICYVDDRLGATELITPATALILGTLIAIPGYFEWTILSLLETGVWSSILVLATLNVLGMPTIGSTKRNDGEFHVLVVLALLCRPEAILWVSFFIFCRWLVLLYSQATVIESVKAAAPAALLFLATTACLVMWRKWYFGYPLPNTYYAKVSGDAVENLRDGLVYLMNCSGTYRAMPAAAILPIAALYRGLNGGSVTYMRDVSLCYGVTLLTMLLPLATGGDHFEYARFVQPTMPILLATIVFSLCALSIPLNWPVAGLVLLLAVPFKTVVEHIRYAESPLTSEWALAISGRQQSEKLNVFFGNLRFYPSQGVLVAGGTNFSYKGATNDLLGLNNVDMAHADKIKDPAIPKNHASFNVDVFYKQKPDLFWYGGRFIDNESITGSERAILPPFEARVFRNIHLESQFTQDYSCVLITNRELPYSLIIFAANSFLDRLDPKYYSFRRIPFE